MPARSIAQPAPKTKPVASTGLLEYRSLLPSQEGEAYVRLYPTAGEACAVQVPWWLQARPAPRAGASTRSSPRQCASNARRAAAAVRRSTRANGGRFLWTLTYAAEPSTRAEIVRHLRRFFEDVQGTYGRLWLLAVIEEGAEMGRFHVHFAAGRFLGVEKIRRLWGRGHVFVGDPRRLPGKVNPRKLAAYLAKYVGKALAGDTGDEHLVDDADERRRRRRDGAHRYFVTQGYQPAVIQFRHWDLARALGWLHQVYGAPDYSVAWEDDAIGGVCGVWNSYPDSAIARWRRIAAGVT